MSEILWGVVISDFLILGMGVYSIVIVIVVNCLASGTELNCLEIANRLDAYALLIIHDIWQLASWSATLSVNVNWRFLLNTGQVNKRLNSRHILRVTLVRRPDCPSSLKWKTLSSLIIRRIHLLLQIHRRARQIVRVRIHLNTILIQLILRVLRKRYLIQM